MSSSTTVASENTLASLKLPPHSLEAEQAVLGGLMLDEQAWDRVSDRVKEEDFYRRDHRLIFQAIANRDLVVVRDVVLLLAVFVIAINLLVDLVYLWLDPRLKGRLHAG